MIDPAPSARKVRLRVSEWTLILALAAMSAVAWFNSTMIPLSTRTSLITVGLLFGISAVALGEGQQGWRYWLKELLPVPVVPYMFLNLGKLIPLVNPRAFDAELEALDRTLLGVETQAALYDLPLPAWFADALTVAYSTFFFLGIVLVVALAGRRDPLLPRVTAAVVITFVVSYAGYFVVPAYGPRATVALERYASLPAGLVGAPLRDLLDNWEKTKTDAFPSGHTMVTLAVLYCTRRRARGVYNVLLPVGTMLILATVLLTYHYVVDVLAALPLTVLSLAVAAATAGPIPAVSPAPNRSRPAER
jgi:hypothetical protein